MEAICQALADYRVSLGMGSCPVKRSEYTEFNARQQPRVRQSDELSLTDLSSSPSFVIGNEVSEFGSTLCTVKFHKYEHC